MSIQNTLANDTAETADQYLTFMLGKEEYGVEILKVQEIKSWGTYTRLPRAPEHVLGVINLRGAIVPIVDLRLRFGLQQEAHTATTAIIIVRSEIDDHERIVGLVVDSVSEVYHLDSESIQEQSDLAGFIRGRYIRGLGQIEDKMVIILDLDPVIESSIDPDEEKLEA